VLATQKIPELTGVQLSEWRAFERRGRELMLAHLEAVESDVAAAQEDARRLRTAEAEIELAKARAELEEQRRAAREIHDAMSALEPHVVRREPVDSQARRRAKKHARHALFDLEVLALLRGRYQSLGLGGGPRYKWVSEVFTLDEERELAARQRVRLVEALLDSLPEAEQKALIARRQLAVAPEPQRSPSEPAPP
jgi:hypothetical protein